MIISQRVFKLEWAEYTTEISIFNVRMAVTPKVGKQELRFLFSAYLLVALYSCKTFHENISNGFQVTEQTRVYDRNLYLQYSMGHNSKSRKTRVAERTQYCYRQTDGQTVGKTMSPHPVGVGANILNLNVMRKTTCICRRRSNLQPPYHQSDVHPTEPLRLAT